MRKLTTGLFFMLFALSCAAQYPRVEIPGSSIRKIISTVVSGQEYELQILLPGSYRTGEKKYPVLYLLDSQWDFPLVKSIYGQQYYDGFIPELIIVGITWGGDNPNADSLRVRDYTPTRQPDMPQSGGAEGFLSFVRSELFPFMEKNYRVDSTNRTLMGCSLGGLLTLYTLFTYPEMFQGYAAASPAIGWDRQVINDYEQIYAARKERPAARLYMTIGDVERNVPTFHAFCNRMQQRQYSQLDWTKNMLFNTGHSGTKSETYTRGLQYIFRRPDLKLDSKALLNYTGTYMAGDKKAELISKDGVLQCLLPGGAVYILHAAGNGKFYSTAEFFNLQFNEDKGSVSGFLLSRYGSTISYQRIK